MSTARENWEIRVLRRSFWALFRLFFRFQIQGQEHVPASGPCIVVPNHPTYFDPLFVGLGLPRAPRYMAWDRLFDVPLMGRMITRLGAFPVDLQRPDKSAYKRSLELLRGGEFLVIFPEGGRTKTAPLSEFKPGVARMALATRVPLLPCTILGGDRVWPAGRAFPRRGRIQLVFHPPIEHYPGDGDDANEKVHINELLQQLRGRILAPFLE